MAYQECSFCGWAVPVFTAQTYPVCEVCCELLGGKLSKDIEVSRRRYARIRARGGVNLPRRYREAAAARQRAITDDWWAEFVARNPSYSDARSATIPTPSP